MDETSVVRRFQGVKVGNEFPNVMNLIQYIELYNNQMKISKSTVIYQEVQLVFCAK